MPKKSKSWWLWNVIVSGASLVPFMIAGVLPGWVDSFVFIPAMLIVMVCLIWETAIDQSQRLDLGGPCVHCGGALAAHRPASEFYPDGFCLCGIPVRACGCLGYQPSRRWLDNVSKEDRTYSKDLGGVTR